MKAQELRNSDTQKLVVKIKDLQRELAGATEAVTMGQETNTAKLRSLKKDIARAKTVLSEINK